MCDPELYFVAQEPNFRVTKKGLVDIFINEVWLCVKLYKQNAEVMHSKAMLAAACGNREKISELHKDYLSYMMPWAIESYTKEAERMKEKFEEMVKRGDKILIDDVYPDPRYVDDIGKKVNIKDWSKQEQRGQRRKR